MKRALRDGLFAVIVSSLELPPFMEVSRALAKAKKTPVLDQTVTAKRAGGIVAEHLAEPDATALQQALVAAGLPCRVIPEEIFLALPEARLITQLDLFDPARVVLIGAASVPFSTVTKTMTKEGPSAGHQVLNAAILMSTGLPIKIGGKTKIVEKTTTHSDRLFYLDVVFKNATEHWRIEAEKFDYSCLQERKTVQGFGNFRLLLADLIHQSPNARISRGARVLQENRPILEMDYETLADYDRELRWRLEGSL